MLNITEGMIDRTLYPELDHILWDFHARLIAPDFAFDIYERRWKYLDKTMLTQNEQELINQLAQKYGDGRFLPAA